MSYIDILLTWLQVAARLGGAATDLLFTNGEEVVLAADEDRSVGDGGGGHQDFADRIGREKLELRAGFDYEDVAVFGGEIEFSIGVDGGRGVRAALFGGDALLVQTLARGEL